MKLEVADMLWEEMLTEVALELMAADRKVQRRRSGAAVAS